MTLKEKKMFPQNQEISPEKNILQSSTQKHYTSHETRANNSNDSRLGNKESMEILSDSKTKLLNG